MKKKVIVDFDDVLVPTLEKAIELYNKEHIRQLKPSDFDCWDVRKVAEDFHNYFLKIDFTEIGQKNKSIMYMRELCERYEVYIVTASELEKFAQKKKWVMKNMPFFNIDHMVLCSDKSILKAHAMIDDRILNLKHCDVKYKFLYNTSHNQNCEHFCRVNNLDEMIDRLERVEMIEYYEK